jgi:hypothetical protein
LEQAVKSFPFSKSMMLNVLYDTLDSLGINVWSSNSEQGTIVFQTEDAQKVMIQIDTLYPQETVRLTITAELGADYTDALFDEINSTINSSKAISQKKENKKQEGNA